MLFLNLLDKARRIKLINLTYFTRPNNKFNNKSSNKPKTSTKNTSSKIKKYY